MRCIKILDVDSIGENAPSYGWRQPKKFRKIEDKEVVQEKGKSYTKVGVAGSEWKTDFKSLFPTVKSVLEYDPLFHDQESVDDLALKYRIQHEEDIAFYG